MRQAPNAPSTEAENLGRRCCLGADMRYLFGCPMGGWRIATETGSEVVGRVLRSEGGDTNQRHGIVDDLGQLSEVSLLGRKDLVDDDSETSRGRAVLAGSLVAQQHSG